MLRMVMLCMHMHNLVSSTTVSMKHTGAHCCPYCNQSITVATSKRCSLSLFSCMHEKGNDLPCCAATHACWVKMATVDVQALSCTEQQTTCSAVLTCTLLCYVCSQIVPCAIIGTTMAAARLVTCVYTATQVRTMNCIDN